MSFTEIHIAPRQRTLSITPIVLKFSLLLRDSVLFRESIKEKEKKIIKNPPKKTRKPPLPYKILNLFFHIGITSNLFYGLFCLSQIMYKIKCNDCLIH